MMDSDGRNRKGTEGQEKTRRCGRYSVKLFHLDKEMYPQAGFTKRDVLDYYERVADLMLPHLRERPITLERYPNGIDNEGFIQKKFADHFPSWLQRARVQTSEGEQIVPVCRNLASLLYLVNQGSLTQHVWLSRLDRPQAPDQMIFDLDPPGDSFEPVRNAARDCLSLMDELSLPVYLKTTGSKGLHLVVPLRRQRHFDDVREFARDCARLLVRRFPDRYTLEQRIARRGGRLYLDIQRNAYGQTAVAPYSLRPVPGAPVATPIPRDALDRKTLFSQTYHVKNIFRHLAQTTDPWQGMRRHAKNIAPARGQVVAMLNEK